MSMPGAGAGAPDPAIHTSDGASAAGDLEQNLATGARVHRQASANAHRRQADDDHGASMAAAEATRGHAASLLTSAADMERAAEERHAADMTLADEIENGGQG